MSLKGGIIVVSSTHQSERVSKGLLLCVESLCAGEGESRWIFKTNNMLIKKRREPAEATGLGVRTGAEGGLPVTGKPGVTALPRATEFKRGGVASHVRPADKDAGVS